MRIRPYYIDMRILVLFSLCLLLGSLAQAELNVTYNEESKSLSLVDGKKITPIKIKFPKDMFPDQAHQHFVVGNNLIIVMPLSDGEAGTTFIYSVTKSGKLNWKYDLHGFNAAKPLIEKGFMYVGAFGRVAKLNIVTGKVVWEHKDLYSNQSYKYGGSIPVSRSESKIVFAANLEVDDKTGKIEEVLK